MPKQASISLSQTGRSIKWQVLSLVFLLGLCSVAQAAVKMPTTADQSAIAGLNHGVTVADMPVIKGIEWTEGQIKITIDPNSVPDIADNNYNIMIHTKDDNGAWGDHWYYEPIDETGVAVFAVPEGTPYTNIAEIECSTSFDLAGKGQDAYAYYNGDGELVSYSLAVRIRNGVTEDIFAGYTADDKLTYKHYNIYTNGVNENYSVNYYSTSGTLREYTVSSILEDSTDLSVTFDQFGRITWANYWDGDNSYYMYNDPWHYGATGEPAEGVSVDVTPIEAPYAETYAPTAPATMLENLDLAKGELTIEEDGDSYYYDGAVNARYDENGNLVHYSYTNFENTQEDIFYLAENGNVTSHQISEADEDGYFRTVSTMYYYANSRLPKYYCYVAEDGTQVECNADGSVYYISYYDEETGCYYDWSEWNDWEVTDEDGSIVDVDDSALPDPQAYKVLPLSP